MTKSQIWIGKMPGTKKNDVCNAVLGVWRGGLDLGFALKGLRHAIKLVMACEHEVQLESVFLL